MPAVCVCWHNMRGSINSSSPDGNFEKKKKKSNILVSLSSAARNVNFFKKSFPKDMKKFRSGRRNSDKSIMIVFTQNLRNAYCK